MILLCLNHFGSCSFFAIINFADFGDSLKFKKMANNEQDHYFNKLCISKYKTM